MNKHCTSNANGEWAFAGGVVDKIRVETNHHIKGVSSYLPSPVDVPKDGGPIHLTLQQGRKLKISFSQQNGVPITSSNGLVVYADGYQGYSNATNDYYLINGAPANKKLGIQFRYKGYNYQFTEASIASEHNFVLPLAYSVTLETGIAIPKDTIYLFVVSSVEYEGESLTQRVPNSGAKEVHAELPPGNYELIIESFSNSQRELVAGPSAFTVMATDQQQIVTVK